MKETKYTVKYTTSFKKDYKRAIKRGLKILCGYPQVLLLQYYPANLLHSFFFSVPHGKFLAQEDDCCVFFIHL